MGIFSNNKKGTPPHTWYPDILHWQEGDEIYCWGIMSAFGLMNFSIANYHKYDDSSGAAAKGTFYFKSVDENGNIFLEDENENIVQFEFWRFIKKARNESLKSRQKQQQLKESEEYMDLIYKFQKAFNELQESDGHPHRLGEPKPKERPNQSKKQNRRDKQKN
jgi:hypothetical protein